MLSKHRGVIALILAVLLSSLVQPIAQGSECKTPIKSAPIYQKVDQAGLTLVTKFVGMLQKQDVKGLQVFMSPAFEIQRSDGTGFGKKGYLKELPNIKTFTISKLHASQSKNSMSVRYLMDATGEVNGSPYSPGPAPRISSFAWNGCQWQITSHANFNSMTPAPKAGIELLLNQESKTVLDQPLKYLTSSPEVTSSIITMLPGEETGRHRHDAPLYAYVLSGQVTVSYDGGIVKTYVQGTALLEATGVYHNGVNTGKVPVRLLIVNLGATGVANTVKV